MATVERASATVAERRIVLYDVPWATYLSLSNAGSDGPVRLAYNQGVLEIMAPSYFHELLSHFIDRLIDVLTEEYGLEVRSGGSTTMRSEPARKGAEADQMYHIRHEAAVRGTREFDPSAPPDLAVEVDISASSSRRLPIYSALGIPEVWRCDGERLTFLALGHDGEYGAIAASLSFPGLSPVGLEPFLAKYDTMGENTLVREFRQWVREHLSQDPTA
ncbi:MAG TPA: Uma2 family endonuclease [Pirellulales bacterium]|jgi:Uma2 family endonuclease|nr:Uma2 family endonuclease [Pirellulales bacterium]